MSKEGGRWSKKSQNLVNVVCERLLKENGVLAQVLADSEIYIDLFIVKKVYLHLSNLKLIFFFFRCHY